MSKTYRRARTINKARKSRAVERIERCENRIMSQDELMEFIDCCNKAKAERNNRDAYKV